MATVYQLNAVMDINFKSIVSALENMNAELVHKQLKEEIVLICLEKYYFRNSSYAGITIQMTKTHATIVGFAGGSGIFNISLGCERELTLQAFEVLEKHGYKRLDNTDYIAIK